MDNNTNSTTPQDLTRATSVRRRLGILAAGIGLGALVAYLFSRARRGEEAVSTPSLLSDHIVDDRGTGQVEAAQMLRNLRDRAFEASDEKLAVALGRPMEEITAWHAGLEMIDDDVVMKARGIAMNRGVRIE